MRVCYWGTYDASYVRNRVLIRGLRLAGAEVSEQHANLWSARDERVREASRRSPSLALVARAAWGYLRLSVRLLATRRPDVVIVGYPGQVDVLVARVLCWIRRIPLVFDAYLSAYETAVIDRGLLSPRSFQARVLRHVERLGCRLADLVLDVLERRAHMPQAIVRKGRTEPLASEATNGGRQRRHRRRGGSA